MANGNNVQIIIQAVDSASNVFRAIGSSSEGMGQSVEKAMASATRDAQKAQAAMIGLSGTVNNTIGSLKGLVAGAGLIGIGATIVNAAKNWSLAVYDLRRAIGGTAEDASQLLAIGKYAGIGTEEAAGYFAKFGKAISKAKDEMAEAAAKGKTSNDMFTRLGLTLSDLAGKNSAEIFAKVATKMRDMADGADKDRVAMELFGKSGFQVTEMLNLTEKQMDAVVKKAQDMGLIVDDQTVNAWKNLDRQINAVLGTGQKLAIQIGNDMLPVLESKVATLKDMTDSYGKLSPEMRQVIGLTIEASGEMAAFLIGARAVAAFMPYFSAALLSPWTAVIAAIGIAIGALYTYADTRNKVQSYNSKAEVYEDSDTGKLYKKQWVEDTGVTELGTTTGGYMKVELSPEEYEAHNQWKNPPKIPDVPKGTTLAPVSTDGGGRHNKGANKYEDATRRAENLMAELDQKIMEQSGSTYEISSAKLNSEVTKWKTEMAKMQEAGVDTSGLGAKIEEYQTVYTEKIKEKWRESWTAVRNNTKLIGAQITGDKANEAEAEYQISLQRIEKERKDREKEIRLNKNDAEAIAAAKIEADSKIAKAAQIRDEKIRADRIEKYQREMEYATLSESIEGNSNEKIDQMRSNTLQNYINYLRAELNNKTLTDSQKLALEKNLNEAINQQHEIAGRKYESASAEAMRRLKAQNHDYAADMVETFNEMNGQITDHLSNILIGTESFSQGFRGIISDLANDVIKMFVKMWTNKYIMGPLQSLFSSIIGGGVPIGGAGSGGNLWSGIVDEFATGGLAQGWSIVGEKGPELVNFTNPGRVYTADQTQRALAGGAAPVTVNVINQSGQQLQVSKQETKFDGAETVVNLWLEGYSRNIAGIQTLVPAGGGAY